MITKQDFHYQYDTGKKNAVAFAGDNPRYRLCGCAGVRPVLTDCHVQFLWGREQY